ncbi:hypothetical protein GALL_550900 [mine drainage metagenome]|uniref:Uncharacterized protein n=1 Tax=mine drainage metagenome TaxID=410659 RepID=A0A1J5NVY1_9ZZZZ
MQCPPANGSIDFGHPGHPSGVAGQCRILTQIIAANGVHQAFENAVAVACHQGVAAVLAPVSVARCDTRQSAAARATHFTESAVFGQQAFHAVEHRLVQSHINDLPLTRTLALMQRQQDADDTVQRGQRVADADTHTHRHPTRFGAQVAQAAHGFGDHAKTGLVAVGASLSVTADAQHDQARVDGHQLVGPQAPGFHGTGTKIFNQNVGLEHQLAHNVLRLTVTQIKRQRAFAA